MTPLAVHEALLTTTYPTSLAVSADGETLAYVAATAVGLPEVFVLGTGPGAAAEPARHVTVEDAPVMVRWAIGGARLWIVSAPADGEPCRLSLHDVASGVVLASGTCAGAIEDVVVVDETTVALRVADPGSDRDGMNLALRVTGCGDDPRVETSSPPLRRVVLAHLRAAPGTSGLTSSWEIDFSPLALGGRTVWDFDLRMGRLVAVVSEEPLPAGYYQPTLVTARVEDALVSDIRELFSTGRQLARPRLSPNGLTVGVLEGISIVSGRLLCIDVATAESYAVAGLDDVTDFGWLTDREAYVSGWHDVGVQVGVVAGLDSPDPSVRTWNAAASIPGDTGQPTLAVSPSGGPAYAVWETPERPPEVVALSLLESGTTELSSHNAHLRSLAADVVTEPIAWLAPDGAEIHGLLLTPWEPGTAPEAPRPLVVLLHGGPTWLWSSAFAPAESNHLALPLVAAGAAVLLPNPRGSSGRGQDFAAAVIGQMGRLDLQDVLAGVDHLVDTGRVDAGRVATMGLSYGGYLSAMAALRPETFAASVVLSGVSDWLSFATTSAIGGGYDRFYQPGGHPESPEGRAERASCSPIYQDIEAPGAPTLIIHGALDRVTPLNQAEQLHRRWRQAGTEVELVVYPEEGHELVAPARRRDAAARALAWLTAHGVLGEDPTP